MNRLSHTPILYGGRSGPRSPGDFLTLVRRHFFS
jgi:hypothetical protein